MQQSLLGVFALLAWLARQELQVICPLRECPREHEIPACRVLAELALGREPSFDIQPLSVTRAAVGLQSTGRGSQIAHSKL